MRRGLILQLAALLLTVVVVGMVLTMAMCGGGDGESSSTPLSPPSARGEGRSGGAHNPSPHPSRGKAGGVRIPVRRATAAELGYSDTLPVQDEVVETDSMTPSNSPLAGGGTDEVEERLERELEAARQEAALAEVEAERLRQEAAAARLRVEVTPLSVGLAGGSLTPPMDSAEWMETGDQDIPESPSVLHCGRKPSGYRYADSDRYLHRFTAAGPFLVFIDGEWSRSTGRTEELWVDLGTVREADGRVHARRKMVSFCPAGSVGYVRPDPSVEIGEITIMMFGENTGSARGISYVGGESWNGLWAARPSMVECTYNVCQKEYRGSREANRYFRWLQRTYTPSPGDVDWAED